MRRKSRECCTHALACEFSSDQHPTETWPRNLPFACRPLDCAVANAKRPNWPAPLPPANRPRLGRNKLAIRRALLAYGNAFSTRQLLRFIYPRLKRWEGWRWREARLTAQRCGMVRAPGRRRPLLWILPPIGDGR